MYVQRCSLATSQRCSLATSQHCSHCGKAKVGRGMGTRLGAVSLVVMVTQHMPCRYPPTEHEQEGGSDWTKFKCYQNHARQLQCKPTTTHLAHHHTHTLIHSQAPPPPPGFCYTLYKLEEEPGNTLPLPYSTIPYYTLLHSTILHHTLRYSTIPYHTPPYSTILNHTLPYSTIPYHTPPYSTILNHTLPYSTILYHTLPYSLPYSTILYHTLPYSTILYHTLPYSRATILLPACKCACNESCAESVGTIDRGSHIILLPPSYYNFPPGGCPLPD